jgi:hypothetical protein
VLKNDGESLQWQTQGRLQASSVQLQGGCADFFIDELDIRSFAIQFL